MASQIKDFAEWFKVRKTKVESWYSDGVGKFAFRVTVDGQAFVCAARSSASDGRTSIMKRVAGKAQVNDALIALRIGDSIRIFDPVTVLGHGNVDEPHEDDRKKRGEKWVYFDVDLGCRFREWYDGTAKPVAEPEPGP